MADYYEYSNQDLIKMLGIRFKDYRLRSQMTQADVAEQSGISVNTIHKFENGTSGKLSLSTFLSLLKGIGELDGMNNLLPELPESAYLLRDNQKKVQRIRHKRR